MTSKRSHFVPLLVIAFIGVALVASGCRRVGHGQVSVANDLSGIGRDNTFIDAFASDPGDAWPPPGYLNLFVKGDDFGAPPTYGMSGYLYLVRSANACPQSEGVPETFALTDVTIAGIITITAGSANQFVTMQDTPANRQATWALIEIPEAPTVPGGHMIRRCGAVTWSP